MFPCFRAKEAKEGRASPTTPHSVQTVQGQGASVHSRGHINLHQESRARGHHRVALIMALDESVQDAQSPPPPSTPSRRLFRRN